jgi:hypothetical protein
MIEAILVLNRVMLIPESERSDARIEEMLKEINPSLVALRQHIGLNALEDYLLFHDEQDGTKEAESFDRELVDTILERAEQYRLGITADQTKRTAQLFQRFKAKLNATQTEQCSEVEKVWYNSPLSNC